LRPKEKAAPKGRLKFEVLPINAQGRGLVHRAREASSAPHFAVARYPALPAPSADGTQIPASVAQPVSRGSAHSGRFIKSPIPHLRHVAAGFRGVECPGFSQTKDTFTMKYGLLFGCAAIALMAVPVAASAGSGVPGGMTYGFNRGSEIAGPVIGGIPGAVVGGVTGGVEGVLGIEHHPQPVAYREEYRPIRPAPHVRHHHHRRHHHHD